MIEPGARIAFIGLGQMGLPMIRNLTAAGFAVAAHDISPDALKAAGAVPGVEVATACATAVAGSSAVILMLPDADSVRAVLVDGGVIETLDAGATIIDMTSSEPLVTRELAGAASARGVKLVDAPVSGGVIGAEQGTLTIMAGGEQDELADVAAVLQVLGSRVVHAGPVGAGHALKALNNLLSGTSLLVTSEAVAIGERFGLDPQVMIDAINTASGRSFSTELKFPRYVLPEKFDSGFALRLMAKDMQIALSLGRDLGVEAELASRATALWNRAASDLGDRADHTEIARWVDQYET